MLNTFESFRTQSFEDFEVVVIDDGDDTETPLACAQDQGFKIQYHRMNRDRTQGYNNPCVPNNVGIRMAHADTIILQNAEVRHSGEVIGPLAARCDDNAAVFTEVRVLDEHGGFLGWYCHKEFNPRPFFFCGALRKSWFEKLRGFDEDYVYYGCDDDDLADRLALAGVQFNFTDITTEHQWHPTSYDGNDANNQIPLNIYRRKTAQIAVGEIGIERNLGREWGRP